MKTIIQDVAALFETHFNAPHEILFHAPGRVNLIGEHTDYNNGFVLPCAIDRGTYLAIKTREDNLIRVVAGNLSNAASEWPASLPVEHDQNNAWADYIRGVTEQLLKQGHTLKGMDIAVLGNVPQGAGLSSSASFSVGFATACNAINTLGLSPTEVALCCQAAENEFAGCNCGIMDQLISAAGEAGHALLIDCGDYSYEPYAIPEDLAIMIIDSKVKRGLVDSEYNTRRKQCEKAASIMGVSSLRDATLSLLAESKNKMTDEVFRRAKHVITENQRTIDAAEALANKNYALLNKLMAESHISMRDDFEVTTSQIDLLVELAGEHLYNDGGVRMTGGGFGGCVVALVPKVNAEAISTAILKPYKEATNLDAEIHICLASAGAAANINN
ncbi:galactokinase [Saccharophagus degradans]|uniref:galactokinase n=1 Tax=Saccharophagus degradans TaxID=86304 RepID=UPI001C0A1A8F|nr:galactokinase [Saccharophagus degradans]MBU2985500.1 galactokinase [Saccharophagus degradans]